MFLGTLRAAVYLMLAGIFLLPAWQTWEKAEKRSRVLLLLDVSPSVTQVSDDLPDDGAAPVKPSTRLDKVINFLTDKQVNFLARMQEQNPVYVYRFGGRLHEEAQVFDQGKPADWDAERWAMYGKLHARGHVGWHGLCCAPGWRGRRGRGRHIARPIPG